MKKKLIKIISNIFLSPLSIIWESIYRARRFCHKYGILKSETFQVPIISIGNITFGGTGKTPFTMWLADYLTTVKRKKAFILMRGYKGALENSRGILSSDAKLGLDAVEYGDEALLFARRLNNVSVIVGKNRSSNLKYYFDQECPDVVLLDDGHQHLKLNRELNIVLFDALMPIDNYKVAPRGYLREGFTALKDADVIIFGRCDQVDSKKLTELKDLVSNYTREDTIFGNIFYKMGGLYNRNYKFVKSTDDISGINVICVAGIASPASFFNAVESLGANIIKRVTFPDHHYFLGSDMSSIFDLAEKENALVITTEKDMVKMRRVVDDDSVLYLEIKVEFLNGEDAVKDKVSKLL